MSVTGCLILGPAPEIFLEAVLEGLSGAVDRLVVNCNGAENPGNLQILRESQLFREGRLEILQTTFVGFATARNQCLERATGDWVLHVDADEVHGPGLAVITRQVLPLVPPEVSRMGGYLINFMQSFQRYTDISGKPTMLCRRTPELAWQQEVHEKLHCPGGLWKMPYALGHYSYCRPPQAILDKWRQYNALGDPTYSAADLAAARAEGFMDGRAGATYHFRGQQLPAIRRLLGEQPEHIEHFERLPRGRRLARSWERCWDQQKIRFRILQTWLRLGGSASGRRATWSLARELLGRLGPWWAWED